MTDHNTLLFEQPVSDHACCDPECGPETCGSGAPPAKEPKAEWEEATAEACCDPLCGPETCG